MWIDVSIVSGYFLKRTVDSEPSLNTVFVFRIYLLLKKKWLIYIIRKSYKEKRQVPTTVHSRISLNSQGRVSFVGGASSAVFPGCCHGAVSTAEQSGSGPMPIYDVGIAHITLPARLQCHSWDISSVGASFPVDHTFKHLTQNCFFFSCLGHGSKEGVPLYFLEFQEYYL